MLRGVFINTEPILVIASGLFLTIEISFFVVTQNHKYIYEWQWCRGLINVDT